MKEKSLIEKLTSAISYVDFEDYFWLENFKYDSLMESPYFNGDYNDRITDSVFGYYSVNRIRDIMSHCHTKN